MLSNSTRLLVASCVKRRPTAANFLLVPKQGLGSQNPQPNLKLTMEKAKPLSPTGSAILNHDTGAPLEVLRREFSTIGEGRFTLFKDDASGVATLTIDHPERKNALSGAMMAQFSDIITELEEWKQVCF